MEAERGVAVDYAQIRDSRGKGELVFVSWIVPQWIQNAHIEPDKYVVLTVTHGKPSIGGTPHSRIWHAARLRERRGEAADAAHRG